MSRRAGLALGIITLWLAGIAALTRREVFGGEDARLANAALHVAPGALYYTVWQDGRQIGFASSTIDTTVVSFELSDLLITSLPDSAAQGHWRFAARSTATLTRGLRLSRFSFVTRGRGKRYGATGVVYGDSLLQLSRVRDRARPDTARLALNGPPLVPGMLPMLIALGEKPSPGTSRTATIFDPVADSLMSATVRVVAESLFVVVDSAALVPGTQRWVAAHSDTVRAWRMEQQGGGIITGWFDERGRLVAGEPFPGTTLRRTAYELAFDNWRNGTTESNDR